MINDLDYGEVEYRVVASPIIRLQYNKFVQFNMEALNISAMGNIPLKSLMVNSNFLPCDCKSIKVGIIQTL